MAPIEEHIPRREFQARRRRTRLSFRRKRDIAWFLLTTVPLIVALTLLVFHVKLRRTAPRPAISAFR